MEIVNLVDNWNVAFATANTEARRELEKGRARNLVVYCDGTWKSEDAKYPSNIASMYKRTLNIPALQRVYYDSGVGSKWFPITGGLFGAGLADKVKQAYRWLVKHYRPGDNVYAFGYSRGAYTVRDLFGFIAKVGLMQDTEFVDTAWRHYRNSTPYEGTEAEFAHTPRLAFLGVYDTVGSLGIPNIALFPLNPCVPYFHDTVISPQVCRALHCVARDEMRAPFQPTFWANGADTGPRVRQSLYAGWHADVGGGNPHAGLSDCALADMMLAAAQSGVSFSPDAAVGIRPDPLAPMHPRNVYGGLLKPEARRIPNFVRDSQWLSVRREWEALR